MKTGLDIGADPATLAGVLAEVRPRTAKPLIVKLTPNTADVAAVAAAAEEAGADAVSLINTLRAFASAPGRPGQPWLGGGTGGLSGPAVRAVALAQVLAVARRVAIPVVGMGGIQTAAHAAEMLAAGATLVAVGTESFRDPLAGGADRGRDPAFPRKEREHRPLNDGVLLRSRKSPCKSRIPHSTRLNRHRPQVEVQAYLAASALLGQVEDVDSPLRCRRSRTPPPSPRRPPSAPSISAWMRCSGRTTSGRVAPSSSAI